MKYLFTVLLITLMGSCTSANGYLSRSDTRIFNTKYDVCKPYYNESLTHSDTLLVDMFRPDDGRFGLTCLEVKRELKNSK